MKNTSIVSVAIATRNLATHKTSAASPYLKSVLAGGVQLFKKEKWLDDRAAASRYIKETRLQKG